MKLVSYPGIESGALSFRETFKSKEGGQAQDALHSGNVLYVSCREIITNDALKDHNGSGIVRSLGEDQTVKMRSSVY